MVDSGSGGPGSGGGSGSGGSWQWWLLVVVAPLHVNRLSRRDVEYAEHMEHVNPLSRRDRRVGLRVQVHQ